MDTSRWVADGGYMQNVCACSSHISVCTQSQMTNHINKKWIVIFLYITDIDCSKRIVFLLNHIVASVSFIQFVFVLLMLILIYMSVRLYWILRTIWDEMYMRFVMSGFCLELEWYTYVICSKLECDQINDVRFKDEVYVYISLGNFV